MECAERNMEYPRLKINVVGSNKALATTTSTGRMNDTKIYPVRVRSNHLARNRQDI
jgi:hypothetical protein